MFYSEYLNIKLTGSKGCIALDNAYETSWDNVRLLITKDGVSKVHTLAGGVENMEEHLNKQLAQYSQQGWQPIRVERPTENSQIHSMENTISCLLKRSIPIESRLTSRMSKA